MFTYKLTTAISISAVLVMALVGIISDTYYAEAHNDYYNYVQSCIEMQEVANKEKINPLIRVGLVKSKVDWSACKTQEIGDLYLQALKTQKLWVYITIATLVGLWVVLYGGSCIKLFKKSDPLLKDLPNIEGIREDVVPPANPKA